MRCLWNIGYYHIAFYSTEHADRYWNGKTVHFRRNFDGSWYIGITFQDV